MKKLITIITIALTSAFAAYCQAPSIIAADGTFLGNLSENTFDPNSIYNEWGGYGNKWNAKSVWNEWGTYGNPQSPESPWNPWAPVKVGDPIRF